MTDDRNRRAETAKRHDDSHLRSQAETPEQQGRAGGTLNRNIGTQAAEERVHDPEATEGVDKEDEREKGDR